MRLAFCLMAVTNEARYKLTYKHSFLSSGYRGSFPGVTRPEREADHSPVSNYKINNAWCYTSIPQYVFMASCLIKREINLHGVVLI
jgi:hypothetical protein